MTLDGSFKNQFVCAAALSYGEMDDQNAAQMILVGIPLDEPHLKTCLSSFLKREKNDLKAGWLPVTESYYLMGTVDPTGELKEDEVCVILYATQLFSYYFILNFYMETQSNSERNCEIVVHFVNASCHGFVASLGKFREKC